MACSAAPPETARTDIGAVPGNYVAHVAGRRAKGGAKGRVARHRPDYRPQRTDDGCTVL